MSKVLHTEIKPKQHFENYLERKGVAFTPVTVDNKHEIGIAVKGIQGYFKTDVIIDFPNYSACLHYCNVLSGQLFGLTKDQVNWIVRDTYKDKIE